MLEAKAIHEIETPLGSVWLDPYGSSAYRDDVMASADLAGYWRLDDLGTTAVDETAGANGAYWQLSPQVQERPDGSDIAGPLRGGPTVAPVFDANHAVTVPTHTDDALAGFAWSIEGYVRPDSSGLLGPAFEATDGANARGVSVGVNADRTVEVKVGDGSSMVGGITGPALAADEWVHLSARRSAAGLVELLYDGVVKASGSRTHVTMSEYTIAVGGGAGAVAEVALHSAVLSDATLQKRVSRAKGLVDDPLRAFLTKAPSVDINARGSVDVLPQADGAIVGDKYANEAVWTLTGSLFADEHSGLQVEAQRIRGALNSIMRADGKLKWTPAGFVPLQTTIRRHEKPMVGDGRGKQKQLLLSLVAGDPRVYSQVEHVSNDILPDSAGFTSPFTSPIVTGSAANQDTVTNAGDAESPALIYIYGPCTSPLVYNTTRGEYISLPGLTIADGDYVVINTNPDEETVMLLGTSDRYSYVSADSDMWLLSAGANIISFTCTNVGAATKVVVKWRDAWLPA